MSGGHTIGVQASRVETLAGQARATSTELSALAERVGAALRQVAQAVPDTELQTVADQTAGAWSIGLADLARAGGSLAAATQASADAYRFVEGRGVQRFTGPGPK